MCSKLKYPVLVAALALAGCGSDSDSSPQETNNTAPIFTSSALDSVAVGDEYSYTVTVSDAEGDSVTLTANSKPAWLTFDATSGVLSGTPEAADSGSHSVTITANDGELETPHSFTINVSAASGTPDDGTPDDGTPGDAPSDGWTLVWSDEFDGSAIDSAKWEHEVNCDGGGNNEKQCYTADAANSYVEDGLLKIVALPAQGKSLPYSSARLRSLNKGDWTYGRFEVRAKIPTGQGSWPAIWMLPTDWVYGGWPNSGEIDIFESVNLGVPFNDGSGKVQSDVYGTLHYGEDWPNNAHSGLPYQLPNGAMPSDDFHTYAIEWEQGEIRWYVDGVHYQTQRSSEVAYNTSGQADGLIHKGWFTDSDTDGVLLTDAPFDQDFHMILNFAVGGSWPEAVNAGGVDASAFHASNTFEIDFVRVYECATNPTTGQGCATVEDGYDESVADGGTLVEGKAPKPKAPFVPDPNAPDQFFVFVDGTEGFEPGYWNDGGSVTNELVSDDADHGTVLEITSQTPNQVSYLNNDGVDLRNYAGGTVTFDLKVMQQPEDPTANWIYKAECHWPCQSAELEFGSQADFPVGVWKRVTINVDALTGLDLSDVNNALVVFPTWGGSNGAIYRIDNVAWNKAGFVPN